MSSNRSLLIFSKSADHGSVKTRLRELLDDDQCLALHIALLQDTLNKARQIDADLYLYLAGTQQLPFEPGCAVQAQRGLDLGERMKNAFQQMFFRYRRVVIIGTDCPELPAQTIESAFRALEQNDLVVGPAEDGGYYLIGLSKFCPQIFDDVPWGTEEVFQRTTQLAADLKVKLLEKRHDLDGSNDFQRLVEKMKRQKFADLVHTKNWLESWRS